MKCKLNSLALADLTFYAFGHNQKKAGNEYVQLNRTDLSFGNEGQATLNLILDVGCIVNDYLYFSASIRANVECMDFIDENDMEKELDENVEEMAQPLYAKATQLLANLSTEVGPFPEIFLFTTLDDESPS